MTFPIILAHGVCRFDVLINDVLQLDNNDDPKLDRLHYFRGIRTMLKANGFCVYHSKVRWAADVDTRAEDLRLNVAHSMGGLDSRHMLFNGRILNRIHERNASLTTISTPHAGTSFADWGTEHLPQVIPVAKKLGLDLKALSDLRTDRCMAFNNDPEVVKFEQECEQTIRFQTYAGRQEFWGVFDALKLPFYIIEKREGENDGLVSVKSAMWRDRYFKKEIDNTDHLNELGWWEPAQVFAGEGEGQLLKRIHKLYLEIARKLPWSD